MEVTFAGMSKQQKCTFPGGFYSNPRTIFQDIESVGIVVEEKMCLYPYFDVFNFEAIFEKLHFQNTENENNPSRKLQFTHRHKAVSVSVHPNVKGFCDEPFHYASSCIDSLVKELFLALERIGEKASSAMRIRFDFVFKALNEKLEKYPKRNSSKVGKNTSLNCYIGTEHVSF